MSPNNHCGSERRGQVARDAKEVTGVVTHETQYFDKSLGRYNTRYFGVTLMGEPWESTDPTWVAPHVVGYYFPAPA